MPKPTRQERIAHKKFLQRQNRYERKYRKQFYKYLQSVNISVANWINANGTNGWEQVLETKDIEPIYRKLYTEVTLNEAEYSYRTEIKPLGGNKDLIDDLAGILGFGQTEGSLISVWRNLLDEFIQVRIMTRITMVNNTTREHLEELIQKAIEDGLGAQETARLIRRDFDYNRNRSLTIARTETITAMNQGKYLSAVSSPFVMEKRWIPTLDARTRISHRGMYDTPFIDMDQFFWIANNHGMLERGLYPCAETFTASNTVNCRCSISFRAKRDENGRLIRK